MVFKVRNQISLKSSSHQTQASMNTMPQQLQDLLENLPEHLPEGSESQFPFKYLNINDLYHEEGTTAAISSILKSTFSWLKEGQEPPLAFHGPNVIAMGAFLEECIQHLACKDKDQFISGKKR